VFTSSAEFEGWFSSWSSGDEEMEGRGTKAAQAALREEQMLIVTNRLHQVLRPFVLRRTKDILESALPTKTERSIACPMSAYQRTMLSLLADKCTSKDIRGVNNVLMEMRKICNDPLLSKLHVAGVDSQLSNHCLPASVQIGGKMAILLQLLYRLHFLGAALMTHECCMHHNSNCWLEASVLHTSMPFIPRN
jgi:SNF2 family DNA or RNA helicase